MGFTNIFVDEEKELWESASNENYKKIEHCLITQIDRGFILPLKKKASASNSTVNQLYSGGVCDSTGNFIAGLIRKEKTYNKFNFECQSAYPFAETNVQVVHREVVFGGIIIPAFGHMLVETLSRLWYVVQDNQDNDIREIVFLTLEGNKIPDYFYQFLSLLGIPQENITILEKPTRFDKIIVPDQSLILFTGYHPIVTDIYDKMIQSAIKNVEENQFHKKTYLSRSKFPKKDCINETYFEDFFRKRNYRIIYPEQETLQTQIATIYHADHIICTAGTLSHLLLFAKEGTEVTLLLRTNEVGALKPQLLMNQIRKITCHIIDVSYNFLPTSHAGGRFLLGPTNMFIHYLEDRHIEYSPEEVQMDWEKCCFPYIQSWLSGYCVNAYPYRRINQLDIFDIINRMSTVINQKSLRREDFSTPSKIQLREEIKFLKSADTLIVPKDLKAVCKSENKQVNVLSAHYFIDLSDLDKQNQFLKYQQGKQFQELFLLLTAKQFNNINHWNLYGPLLGVYTLWKKMDADYFIFSSDNKLFNISDANLNVLAFSNIDLVVPFPSKLNETVEEQFKKYYGEAVWRAVKKVVELGKHNDTVSFSDFCNKRELFTNHMFMMRKDCFYDYCDWLFDMLQKIEIDSIKHIPGILNKISERLLSFWILNQKKKYKLAYCGVKTKIIQL